MPPSTGVTPDHACVCGARQAPTLVSCPDTGFPVSYWWMGAWWEQRTFIGAVDTYELLASVGEGWGRGRKKRRPLPMPFQRQPSLRAGAQGLSQRLASKTATGPMLSRAFFALVLSQARIEVLVPNGTLPLGKLSPGDGGEVHSPLLLSVYAKSPQAFLLLTHCSQESYQQGRQLASQGPVEV